MDAIALVGNPNSGKTTLFNALTGSNQHVGNWPGVTVEKKEGSIKHNNLKYNIVDLPGTYSLGAYSEDEVVARDFILKGDPDVVINVVDATNLERNLYLTTQLLEMGTKVIVALNMMDEAKTKMIDIDIENLSKRLGIPVIPIIASKRKGIDVLIERTVSYISESISPPKIITYGDDIDQDLKKLMNILSECSFDYSTKWMAIKILEGDEDILKHVEMVASPTINQQILDFIKDLSHYELEIVDKRYGFINTIVKDVVTKPKETPKNLTDTIDKVLTNKYLGLPIFALIMFLVFQLTFTLGEDVFGDLIVGLIDGIGNVAESLLISLNSPDWLISFVRDGAINGVGAVLEFIPLIMILYFFLGILEDTGYMARAAYVMDTIMRTLGLHGKTFISMIVGFGCNVPGIMATRTLDSKKDRMIALLINPFMSCGARLPIYLVFIAAFFEKNGGLVLFALYATGIIVALVMGKIFSKTLFKGESSHFIMELPPYRLPSFRSVVRDMWDKVWDFIKRAGTIIFLVVSILWVLSIFPLGVEPYSQASILGRIGTFIAPIFKPAGFGTWQASVSLFAGIAAKEAVVAVLGMVYAGASEGSELVTAIQNVFTPLTALSFMTMVLLYTPCAAVIATVKKETNSYMWAAFMVLYTFVIGWIGAVAVYQIGTLLGF